MKNTRSYEEIKTLLRKAINFTSDPSVKATILHNLSIILYYECKSHNKYVENYKKTKAKIENRKMEIESAPIIDEESRIKRRLSKEDLKFLEKEKKEIENIKLSEINSQDSFYKKLLLMHSQQFKNKEKYFLEISKSFQEQSKNIKEEDLKIEEEALKGSK